MGRTCGGPVPDRWMNCPPISLDIIAEKFVAFKAPLNNNFDNAVPSNHRFTPQKVFQWAKKKKINVGLWIDLTNTSRFYNKEEVENEGCLYHKLSCRGHGETPSEEQSRVFINLVHMFIQKNPLKHIAVHCTHGFNRTGFLIVSYLVQKMDFPVESALDLFAKNRPPGIYKKDYIDELYRRYEEDEYPPEAPERPDWCFDETPKPMNSTEEPECSTNSSSQPKRKGNTPTFMEGISGVHHFNEQPKLSIIQKLVQKMCGWESKGFPGSQPVSMDLKNIALLNQKPYRVSWKADGMRYMMLIDSENEVYFFDRDHNAFRVEGLFFPHRKDINVHLRKTLLDGEMVIDKVNGENIPRYLVYDMIRFENQEVLRQPFKIRYDAILKEIINPRYYAMEKGVIIKTNEPFSVRRKEFWDVTQAGNLLGEKFARSLSHEPDGLIFQPANEPYKPGTCADVLKWKPLDMNSIDFKLRIIQVGGKGLITQKVCALYVGQLDEPFAKMRYKKELKEYENKIIECKYENNEWKFMRVRTDKSFPNSLKTAEAVWESIIRPVTKDILLNYIADHRFDIESELMPPPSKRIRRPHE